MGIQEEEKTKEMEFFISKIKDLKSGISTIAIIFGILTVGVATGFHFYDANKFTTPDFVFLTIVGFLFMFVGVYQKFFFKRKMIEIILSYYHKRLD